MATTWLLAPMLLAAADGSAKIGTADAATRSRANIALAAYDAARAALRDLRCRVHGETIVDWPASEDGSGVKIVKSSGSMAWRHGWLHLTMQQDDDPNGALVCYVREQRLQLQYMRTGVPGDIRTFSILPPVTSRKDLWVEELARADLEQVFAGPVLALRSGVETAESSEDEQTIRFQLHFAGGGGMDLTLGKQFDCLPVAVRNYAVTKNGVREDAAVKYGWQRIAGVLLPKQLNKLYWYLCADNVRRQYPGHFEFTDCIVNQGLQDADFSINSLPMPVGSLGVDRRQQKAKALIRDVAGIVPRAQASPTAEALANRNSASDDGAEAERARQVRNAYRWRVAAAWTGAGAVALALLGWWLRRRARDL